MSLGPGSFGLLIMPNSVFAAIHIDMKIESFKCAKIFLYAFFNQFFRCSFSGAPPPSAFTIILPPTASVFARIHKTM